jgi:hypothetical protein
MADAGYSSTDFRRLELVFLISLLEFRLILEIRKVFPSNRVFPLLRLLVELFVRRRELY